MSTHAMETPAQTPLPPSTLQPTVKMSRKVPTNSAAHLAAIVGSAAMIEEAL
eukprot:CAMPEP_0197645984 /NCGR_PEP_ID=MMETSP1338-20131121/21367_1 /TAXON_ID=43686 ORGANISM="Pelagodinium beii, Strain RCC1491" /NCGR_SAMPLE_ID=MMETSP1338 /ASSEMBLY_ACC=CAM_ASM_000754 /LENGTH=51 /DNA_ID=CAMNT_0043219563 /DNA_START=4 /DNA_END=159 /DNA_ORIENTATION=-